MQNKELRIIRQNLAKSKPDLKKNYAVKRVGVFGSVARGEQKKSSDLDVLVEFQRPIGFFKFIELENFLSKKLGRRVDLMSKKSIKSVVKKVILKETIYV
ncbi:MAG: nucleotidyltransferase family protein [Patescibacteria group bacterium]